MRSPANARKPLRKDGRTCRKTVTGGRVDQRTHVHVNRGSVAGISGFGRTDGGTEGQPENKMPPVPKGGGITIRKEESWNFKTPNSLTGELWGVFFLSSCENIHGVISSVLYIFYMKPYRAAMWPISSAALAPLPLPAITTPSDDVTMSIYGYPLGVWAVTA